MLSGPTSHLSSTSTKAAAVGGGLCLVEGLLGGRLGGWGAGMGKERGKGDIGKSILLITPTVILRNEILHS